MAVVPDATNNIAGGVGTSSLTTTAFTITASANRGALLGLIQNTNGATSVTSTCGGVSGALVTSADTTTLKVGRAQIHRVKNPASGSQTASMSWGGDTSACSLGVITASGVDQTTTANNGTTASGSSATPSVTVTSPSGDMSFDTTWPANNDASPTQTQVWQDGVQTGGGGSRKTTISNGGTTAHSWTQTSGNWASAGANMIALATGVSGEDVSGPAILRSRMREW